MTRRASSLAAAFAASLIALGAAGAATAAPQALATPDEARAMLDRAVEALRAGEAAALARFNAPDGGFRDRDLYVFCAGPDGTTTAHVAPSEIGREFAGLVDARGQRFGEEILAVAAEGRVDTVDYAWPLPAGGAPVAKTSFVTRVGGQACGVGYYAPAAPAVPPTL